MEWIRKNWWWLLLIILVGGAISIYERWDYYREHSQDKAIRAAAARYGMDPSLVKAVVWRESRFNPKVRGRAGEIGLMQIRKEAAHEWATAERISFFSHEQLFDPRKNTMAGTWYLRKLTSRYTKTDNPLAYGLADYNAGRTHVLRWLKGKEFAATNSAAFMEEIAFPSTREYVKSVLERYQHDRDAGFTLDGQR